MDIDKIILFVLPKLLAIYNHFITPSSQLVVIHDHDGNNYITQ